MKIPRFSFLAAVLVTSLAGGSLSRSERAAEDRHPVATVVSEQSGAVVLRLEAPAPTWSSGSGYLYPVVKGFGLLSEEGKPVLPVRVEHVAIPRGAQPRLTILETVTETAPAGRIGPVQAWIPLLPGSRDFVPVGTPDPAVYEADADFPAGEPVRMGGTGLLREQPFVDLIFTPVLHNPARGTSVVYRSVTVRVEFGIVPPMEEASPDPAFENVYDAGLVNARQSRQFRGSGGALTVDADDGGRGTAGVRAPSALGEITSPLSVKYKLKVNRDGIYRLNVAWVTANAPDLLNYGSARFRLDCQGQQVPITVVDADGTFNGGDYIEFYGQALTWDPFSRLAGTWDKGDFTDDNVYWLYADSGSVSRVATRAGAPTGYPLATFFTETVHQEIGNRFNPLVPNDTVNHWYQDPPVVANDSDGTCGIPVPVSQTYIVQTPGLAPDNAFTDSIKVRLLGDNYLNNYHRSTVKVNTSGILTNGGAPSDWNGWIEFTHGVDDGPATFPQSILNDATPSSANVTVSLPLGRVVGPTCITHDVVFQEWIDLTYKRTLRMDTDVNGDGTDDQVLVLSLPNQNTQVHITGFSQNASAIYEITGGLGGTPLVSPVRITGAQVTGASAPFSVDFQFDADGTLPGGTLRRFAVATITSSPSTGDLVPASVKADIPSNLHSPATGADWLVIANASLLDTTPGSAWQQLANPVTGRRAAQGLRVRVVDVEDVYDEFSNGISDPKAIRDFIAYVYASWPRINPNVPVSYVLLIGDASFDYKNGLGNAQNKNLLPSFMRSLAQNTVLGWMSDESYFSTVSGNEFPPLPDLLLGRWPVHSIAETNAVAQKILNYETAAGGASWQSDVVFVADDDETSFMTIQDQEWQTFLGPPYSHHQTYEQLIKQDMGGVPCLGAGHLCNASDRTGCCLSDAAIEMTARLQCQFNGTVAGCPNPYAMSNRDIGPGAAIVSYVGHGSWQNWGSNFSFMTTSGTGPDNVDSLTNAAMLPLILVADCLSGGFTVTSGPAASTDLTYAFPDDFLSTANKGAIAIISPSHLTASNAHQTVEDTIFGEVFGPRKTRVLGQLNLAVQLAFGAAQDTTNLESYTLFGDPAVRLIVPAPLPPTNVIATPGNRQVSLSWTASMDPSTTSYNVYQTTNPTGISTKVGSNVTSTALVVSNLTNCTTYYYHVVSVNAGGFEGAWSNFNDACNTGGPCVRATPVNPSAPSGPSGVTALDAESGGSVRVSWSPNSPGDDVEEYRVYWGTSPGSYPFPPLTGLTGTTTIVSGLTNGATYYFAVSAVNCSHGEGAKSVAVVTASPHRIEGIKPPNSIDDLRISRSGADNRLQWTPPAANIYGQAYPNGAPPVTITSHEIYSGTTPSFIADVAHRIATVSGTTSSFLHAGAFSDAQPHYYLIVAIDSAGNRSGIGQELPRGIDQLIVQRSGSNLALSWPAVTLDLDGRKTNVTRYQLYGSASPFGRASIGSVTLVNGNIVGTSLNLPIPAGAMYCYSLVAVDSRGALSPW